jgi:hypothetical protein
LSFLLNGGGWVEQAAWCFWDERSSMTGGRDHKFTTQVDHVSHF